MNKCTIRRPRYLIICSSVEHQHQVSHICRHRVGHHAGAVPEGEGVLGETARANAPRLPELLLRTPSEVNDRPDDREDTQMCYVHLTSSDLILVSAKYVIPHGSSEGHEMLKRNDKYHSIADDVPIPKM